MKPVRSTLRVRAMNLYYFSVPILLAFIALCVFFPESVAVENEDQSAIKQTTQWDRNLYQAIAAHKAKDNDRAEHHVLAAIHELESEHRQDKDLAKAFETLGEVDFDKGTEIEQQTESSPRKLVLFLFALVISAIGLAYTRNGFYTTRFVVICLSLTISALVHQLLKKPFVFENIGSFLGVAIASYIPLAFVFKCWRGEMLGSDPGFRGNVPNSLRMVTLVAALLFLCLAFYIYRSILQKEAHGMNGQFESKTATSCFQSAESAYNQAIFVFKTNENNGKPLPEHSRVLRELGHLQKARHDYAKADQAFSEAVSTAERSGDKAALFEALSDYGWFGSKSGRPELARKMHQREALVIENYLKEPHPNTSNGQLIELKEQLRYLQEHWF